MPDGAWLASVFHYKTENKSFTFTSLNGSGKHTCNVIWKYFQSSDSCGRACELRKSYSILSNCSLFHVWWFTCQRKLPHVISKRQTWKDPLSVSMLGQHANQSRFRWLWIRDVSHLFNPMNWNNYSKWALLDICPWNVCWIFSKSFRYKKKEIKELVKVEISFS